jgi:hypothetical protein
MMSPKRILVAGPYYVGESPRPFEVQVTEDDGTPLDLTDAQAAFTYRIGAGDELDGLASVTEPAEGVIRLSWPLFAAPGELRGIVYYTLPAGNFREAAAELRAQIVEPPVHID